SVRCYRQGARRAGLPDPRGGRRHGDALQAAESGDRVAAQARGGTDMSAIVRIPVGVVVERLKAESAWIDFTWRPSAVLPGEPAARPWTMLSEAADSATFYAGSAVVDLHPSETSNYRDNLSTGEPKLWVVLRPTGAEPPLTVVRVTA